MQMLSLLGALVIGVLLLVLEYRTGWFQKRVSGPRESGARTGPISTPTDGQPILAAIAVTKWNGADFKRLDDVSLAVNLGELVAIIGPSGSGRSTLLDTLRGAAPPDSGTVVYQGEDLYPPRADRQLAFGYVGRAPVDLRREFARPRTRRPSLWTALAYLRSLRGLTVERALAIGASQRLPTGMAAGEVRAAVYSALERVALTDKRSLLVAQLNRGQVVRLRIAMELLAPPQVLFLDEVTSELPSELSWRVMSTVRRLAGPRCSVVMVTASDSHYELFDMVVLLRRYGNAIRLVFCGPPQDALSFFRVPSYPGILEVSERPTWPEEFRRSTYYRRYVQQRMAQLSGTHASN